MNRTRQFFLVSALLAPWVGAQISPELVVNGDFESGGLNGWTAVPGSPVVVSYGGPSANLGFGVSSGMAGPNGQGRAGGSWYAQHGSSDTSLLTQSIDLSAYQQAIDADTVSLSLAAFLGGYDATPDGATLIAEYRDAGAAALGTDQLSFVDQVSRNYASNLLLRSGTFAVPPGTTSLFLTLRMEDRDGYSNLAAADNISARLVDRMPIQALPLDQDLLVNGNFESGRVSGQPWDGWVVTAGPAVIDFYGSSGGPTYEASIAMAGPAQEGEAGDIFYARHGSPDTTILEQRFDVRGNAGDISAGQVVAFVQGYLGGTGWTPDRSDIVLQFYRAGPLGTRVLLGTQTLNGPQEQERNGGTNLLLRNGILPIDPATEEVSVQLRMYDLDGYSNLALADNIHFELRTATSPAPQPLDVELLVNADFENSTTIGLPNPSGQPWDGWTVRDGSAYVVGYGTGSYVPTLASAACGAHGTRLLAQSDDRVVLSQEFDVRGNRAQIDAAQVEVVSSASLGGYYTTPDYATAIVRFYRYVPTIAQHVEFGTPLQVGPASSDMRNHETIVMPVEGLAVVPAGCDRIRFELTLADSDGYGDLGLADSLSMQLRTRRPVPAQPYGVELLAFGDFEDQAIVSCSRRTAWVGEDAFGRVAAYGESTAPTAVEAFAWGGGAHLLGQADDRCRFHQSFDLRGNAADISSGSVELKLEAMLGGYSTTPDYALAAVRFFAGTATLGSGQIGPVTNTERANRTTLLRRKGTFPVPQTATRMEIVVDLIDVDGYQDLALADNLSAVLVNRAMLPAYPGTGEDVRLASSVSSEPWSTGPGNDIKDAASGDLLRIRLDSPDGNLNHAPFVLIAQMFNTGQPPIVVVPGLATNPALSVFLINGLTPGIGGQPSQMILPIGNQYGFVVPAGVPGGTSLLVQCLAVPGLAPPPYTPRPANNGLFASTDGHEFRF